MLPCRRGRAVAGLARSRGDRSPPSAPGAGRRGGGTRSRAPRPFRPGFDSRSGARSRGAPWPRRASDGKLPLLVDVVFVASLLWFHACGALPTTAHALLDVNVTYVAPKPQGARRAVSWPRTIRASQM